MVKKHERAIVQAFLTSQGYPISSVIKWGESPDALVRLGDATVGIEVTRLVEATPRQSTAPRKWKREAERVVSHAKASFERRHAVALVVGIVFRPEWRPGKRPAVELAHELATLVDEVLNDGTIREPIQRKLTHPDISWLYVGPTKQSLGGRWEPLSAGDVRPASADDILATVGKKEPKVEAYRRAAADVWLLIDCDLSGQGLALDVPDPSFTVLTSFDRVFCCDFGRWKWVEVPTVPPKTLPHGPL